MIYPVHNYFCCVLNNLMKLFPCLIALFLQGCVLSVLTVWRPIQVIVLKLLPSEDIFYDELVNV